MDNFIRTEFQYQLYFRHFLKDLGNNVNTNYRFQEWLQMYILFHNESILHCCLSYTFPTTVHILDINYKLCCTQMNRVSNLIFSFGELTPYILHTQVSYYINTFWRVMTSNVMTIHPKSEGIYDSPFTNFVYINVRTFPWTQDFFFQIELEFYFPFLAFVE